MPSFVRCYWWSVMGLSMWMVVILLGKLVDSWSFWRGCAYEHSNSASTWTPFRIVDGCIRRGISPNGRFHVFLDIVWSWISFRIVVRRICTYVFLNGRREYVDGVRLFCWMSSSHIPVECRYAVFHSYGLGGNADMHFFVSWTFTRTLDVYTGTFSHRCACWGRD